MIFFQRDYELFKEMIFQSCSIIKCWDHILLSLGLSGEYYLNPISLIVKGDLLSNGSCSINWDGERTSGGVGSKLIAWGKIQKFMPG